MTGVTKELIKIMACPECSGELKSSENSVVCSKCGKKFEIKEGIIKFLE